MNFGSYILELGFKIQPQIVAFFGEFCLALLEVCEEFISLSLELTVLVLSQLIHLASEVCSQLITFISKLNTYLIHLSGEFLPELIAFISKVFTYLFSLLGQVPFDVLALRRELLRCLLKVILKARPHTLEFLSHLDAQILFLLDQLLLTLVSVLPLPLEFLLLIIDLVLQPHLVLLVLSQIVADLTLVRANRHMELLTGGLGGLPLSGRLVVVSLMRVRNGYFTVQDLDGVLETLDLDLLVGHCESGFLLLDLEGRLVCDRGRFNVGRGIRPH